MPKLISRARQLRLELGLKRGDSVSVQEAADAVGLSRVRLTNIELGKISEVTPKEIAAICAFYSKVLGRAITTNDVLEYSAEDIRTPEPVAA